MGVYKKSSPKAVELFIKFCKEKRYNDTQIDEVILLHSIINVGFNSKVFDPSVKENFSQEIVQKNKKIEKNEIIFRADSEGFGMFSIYTGPTAIEANEPLVVLGKVLDSDAVLTKIMDVRTNSEYVPVDTIKILDVEVIQ
jgi:cyclophilin family peptidyl-prolyl cis-trans isomerase